MQKRESYPTRSKDPPTLIESPWSPSSPFLDEEYSPMEEEIQTPPQIGVIKPEYVFCSATPNPSLEEYSPMEDEIQTSPISSTPSCEFSSRGSTIQRAPYPPISDQDENPGNIDKNCQSQDYVELSIHQVLLKKTCKYEQNINQNISNDLTDSVNSYVEPRETPPLCSNFIVSTPPPNVDLLFSTKWNVCPQHFLNSLTSPSVDTNLHLQTSTSLSSVQRREELAIGGSPECVIFPIQMISKLNMMKLTKKVISPLYNNSMPSMEQAFKDKSKRPKIKYFNKKYFPAAVKPHDSLPGQAAGCQPCRQLDVLSQTPFPPSGQLHWREHGQPPQEPGPCQGPTFFSETESSCNPTELVIRSSAPAQYGSLWSPPPHYWGPPGHPLSSY